MVRKWIIILLICNSALNLSGQKVGLVLSGGGSKGLAHIGVIKALEENNIPIDYIGGTSMGAIIGSLYAIGFNTDEMIEIIQSENFNSWLTGHIESEYKYYFKSESLDPDLISIGFDINDTVPKAKFPLSVIPNHLMDFAFMEIYAQASAAANYDFDQLFVPFLCIGSDISNNREVVFRKGDLTQAVRASMTFPLYFRPILIDGNIMYDGGIYNNFPIDRVKEAFHPDFIIGSKTAQGNVPPEEFDIMAQVENMVMQPVDYKIDEKEGILIDMKFHNPSLLDFGRLEEYVQIGYESTLEKIDSIRMRVSQTGPDSLELQIQREKFKNSFPELIFQDMIIDGLDEDQEQYIEKSLRRQADTFRIDNLRKEYLKLANDKNLLYLYPLAEYDSNDSLFNLRLRVVPQSPLEAKFGLFFATTGQSQTFLGLSYRDLTEIGTHFKGNVQFGRFYDGGNLGIRFDYPARIPTYFEGNFNFNRYNYNQSGTDFFFEDLKPPFVIQNQLNFRIDVGVPISINSVFKGGVAVGRNDDIYYQKKSFESTDTSDVSVINEVSIFLAGQSSTLNEKQFPTSGIYRKISARGGYGGEYYKPGSTANVENNQRINYFWITAKYEDISYYDINRYFTLGTTLIIQATFKPLLSNYYSTIIETPVFSPNIITNTRLLEQYRANQFISAGVMPIMKISKQIHAKLEAYAFFPVQEILKNEENQAYLGGYFQTYKPIISASLNILTPVGPISFNTSYLAREEKKWIVQLSFGYMLFNKRTLEE